MSTVSTPSARLLPAGLAVTLALAAVYLIWGSTYFGIRLALEGGYPPLLAVSGSRFIIAGTLMYAVLRWRGVTAPTRAQWRTIAISGAFLLLLGNGFVVLAERSVSSGLAAVGVASMPLWMGLFGVLRGQRSTRIEWLGIGIGFLGVVWLNASSSLTATPIGLVLLLIAPVAWAGGSVWSRGRDLPSPFMTAASQMMSSGVIIVLVGLATGERFGAAPTAMGTLALAYLVVFGSIVAFTAYVWLLHNVRPALASSYAYINPPIAVLFGALAGGERFTADDLGAMAMILVGVIVITLTKARAAKPVAPATAAEPAS